MSVMKFRNRIVFCVMLCVLPFVIGTAEGAFVNQQSARIVAQNWINMSGNKFARDIGYQIKEATHLQGENYGNPGYYFITLSPQGWLIVPADDSYEAILAFGEGNLPYKEYIKAPFAKILRVNGQESLKGNKAMSTNSTKVTKPQNKRWSILLQQPNYQGAGALRSAVQEISSDVVVDKLLGDNNWQQRELFAFDANGNANANAVIPLFFNRHVTWDDDIRYPVGCLPLSTSQIMKYYGHPTTPPMFGSTPLIGVSFDAFLNNNNTLEVRETAIKGGTNPNGSYNWSLMPNNLNASVFNNLADDRPGEENIVSNPNSYEYKVREEISRLLHDLGILMRANYSYNVTTADDGITAQTLYMLNYFSATFANFSNTRIPDVLKTNLDNAYPVLFACNVSDMNGINGHTFVVDGYGHQIYGVEDDKVAYFHCNLGWGDPRFNVWVPLSSLPVGLTGNTSLDLYPDDGRYAGLTYNILSDDKGEGREVHSGRLWLANKPIQDTDVIISYSTPETVTNSKTNSKGVFGFRTFSNVTLDDVRVGSSDYVKEGSLINFIKREDFREIKESMLGHGTGNIYFGDIELDTALINGTSSGMLNNFYPMFDHPMPFTMADTASTWDFSKLSAVFVEPGAYESFTSQDWLYTLANKLDRFVRDGGTLYLTSDSVLFAKILASNAGVRLIFHDKSDFTIIGTATLARVLPAGRLRSAIGAEMVAVPFRPYGGGNSNGPLINSPGNTEMLAFSEFVVQWRGSPYPEFATFPTAVAFNHGKGKVYYTSFAIPSNLDAANPSTDPAELRRVEMSKWFMSQPLMDAEQVRAARKNGITDDNMLSRASSTLEDMKKQPPKLDLPKSQDVTIIATIGELSLSPIDYSADLRSWKASSVRPETTNASDGRAIKFLNYSKAPLERSWRASLVRPDAVVHTTKESEGRTIKFYVTSNDNTGGNWLVSVDEVRGFADSQVVNVYVVNGIEGMSESDVQSVLSAQESNVRRESAHQPGCSVGFVPLIALLFVPFVFRRK